VDKVTVAMNLTDTREETHIVKFEGSIVQFKYHHWMYDPPYSEGPFGTQWHEVNPTYSRQWCIIDWSDQDGFLGYCDFIWMVDKETGEVEEFHVESLSTDIYVTPLGVHDVAVTNVTSHKTVICQGSFGNITVTVENQGYFTETFNVTVYAKNNTELYGIGRIPDSIGGSTTKNYVFTWNATGWDKGNYTIIAKVTIVPGETDTADNTYIDDWVIISMMGDLGVPWPDGKVNIRDVSMVSRGFGANHVTDPASPKYCQYWHPTPCHLCPHSPNCDIIYDGKINIRDVSAVARHFGEEDP